MFTRLAAKSVLTPGVSVHINPLTDGAIEQADVGIGVEIVVTRLQRILRLKGMALLLSLVYIVQLSGAFDRRLFEFGTTLHCSSCMNTQHVDQSQVR